MYKEEENNNNNNSKKIRRRKNKKINKKENYQQFIQASQKLIAALKLTIAKIKSENKKGILFNYSLDLEDNITENATTETIKEIIKSEQNKLEMPNIFSNYNYNNNYNNNNLLFFNKLFSFDLYEGIHNEDLFSLQNNNNIINDRANEEEEYSLFYK